MLQIHLDFLQLLGVAEGASVYSRAEQTFIELLNTEDLDSKIWCALLPPLCGPQKCAFHVAVLTAASRM